MDFKKIAVWGSIPAAIIAISGFIIAGSKTITVYAELPQQVNEVKKDVSDIQDYIKAQNVTNSLLQKIVSKQESNQERILSPDGTKVWNVQTNTWDDVGQ